MSRHDKYIQTALRLSSKSSYPTYKLCALLVKSGSIINVGWNKHSSGEAKDARYKHKGIHAELDAIIGIDWEVLRGAELYVAGTTKVGNKVLSKPCESCTAMLKELPLKGVYYHTKDLQTERLVV